ncbi:MAG: NAD(P)/FAD-dependent oxidoreductase [Elusimicrobiota bacterium]|nr:NAD(P)/FAD-dependent oxidoreductase [Elusimicrobiota bacterium]
MKKVPGQYDAVIIGAGPGGLSAGLSLVRRGWKVLIAEKNGVPGGNCTSRKVGGYTFDLAVHQLSGIGGGGICAGILREYGLSDKMEFRQVDPFLVVDMPDRSYTLRGSRNEFRDELLKDFPGEKKDIDLMLSGLDSLKKDALLAQRLLHGGDPAVNGMIAKTVDWLKIATFPFTFLWGLVSGIPFSADAMLRRWVSNEKLRAVVHASWVYLGLPPKRISGVMMDVFLAMQHMEHTYYPVGSSQKLADIMAEAFRANGGELLLNSPVRKILTEKGRACGVELAGGRTASAGIVISNADALHTYRQLLEPGAAPAGFMPRLERMKLSMGPFRVCLGLDYDVAAHGMDHHEYMIFPGYDHEAAYGAMERGEPVAMSVYSPTKICPELAPPGHSTLILTTMLPWRPEKDWRGRTEALAAEMIALAEKKRLPGLARHIVVKQILTPEGLRDLTNTAEGSMYGWANTPEQTLSLRLSMKSPVPGLYHTGHWTRPGTGVTTAILSGWMLGNRLNSLVGKIFDKLF